MPLVYYFFCFGIISIAILTPALSQRERVRVREIRITDLI
jgi:hypothetical protein